MYVSLETLFPNLNFAVVSSLDRKYIPNLFDERENVPCEIQNFSRSCEFILERVFDISPEIINTPESLLKLLFSVHFTYKIHSSAILKYLADKIAAKRQFAGWDIDSLFRSPENCATFLQERLFNFLDGGDKTDWQISGPGDLDFSSDEIKSCIGRMFAAGYLQIGVNTERLQQISKYLSGANDGSAFAKSLDMVADGIESQIPDSNAPYQAWLDIARDWAELTALVYSTKNTPEKFGYLQKRLNETFLEWQKSHYHPLATLPANPPVMLHQIIRYAKRKLDDEKINRFALIVMDGLSLNQWAAIRPMISEDFNINAHACFAWAPTLTSISRQSIFSGKIPAMFAASISTTAKEENLWEQAWEDYGISKGEILYKKGLGLGSAQDLLDLVSPRIRICGLVIDVVDSIMHGMQLGNFGMHNQLQQWMSTGYLKNLLAGLIDMGFDIVLTSDHGNIECTGIGRPRDGVLSEQRGERVRIYSDRVLAEQVRNSFPQTLDINPAGLPQGMYPVSLPYNLAFTQIGSTTIAHGGNSLEEVIVPMVFISSKRGQ